MNYKVVYSSQAENFLKKLARKVPHIAGDILDKIEWLAQNAEAIKHERLKGKKDFSLHCGQYRLLYALDRENRVIMIEIVGKHDEAYRKL